MGVPIVAYSIIKGFGVRDLHSRRQGQSLTSLLLEEPRSRVGASEKQEGRLGSPGRPSMRSLLDERLHEGFSGEVLGRLALARHDAPTLAAAPPGFDRHIAAHEHCLSFLATLELGVKSFVSSPGLEPELTVS